MEKKMYSAEVKIIWLDSNNGLEPTSAKQTFILKDKQTTYDYIKYYCEHNGVIDVHMIQEGAVNGKQT